MMNDEGALSDEGSPEGMGVLDEGEAELEKIRAAK